MPRSADQPRATTAGRRWLDDVQARYVRDDHDRRPPDRPQRGEPSNRRPEQPAVPKGGAAMLSSAVLVAGWWLLGSPFILGYGSDAALANDVACGAAIVLLSLVRLLVTPAGAFVSGVNAVIGAWTITAAFWLAESATARWNEAIVGGAVLLLATVSVVASQPVPGGRAGRAL